MLRLSQLEQERNNVAMDSARESEGAIREKKELRKKYENIQAQLLKS